MMKLRQQQQQRIHGILHHQKCLHLLVRIDEEAELHAAAQKSLKAREEAAQARVSISTRIIIMYLIYT
jgi:hypothetical protein